MLELVPRFALSERYSVRQNTAEVAEVTLAWMREGGELVVGGRRYELRREGWASGAFQLLHDGVVVAQAHKPSAFSNRFEVRHDGRGYELVRSGWWTRRFELRRDGQTIGQITPHHPFTRRSAVTLPPDLPLPVQVFLMGLVVLMWRREASAAAG